MNYILQEMAKAHMLEVSLHMDKIVKKNKDIRQMDIKDIEDLRRYSEILCNLTNYVDSLSWR